MSDPLGTVMGKIGQLVRLPLVVAKDMVYKPTTHTLNSRLASARYWSQAAVARWSLARGANPNISENDTGWYTAFYDSHSEPLLVTAARDGQTGIMKALLKAGADVNGMDPHDKKSALHQATISGETRAVKLLADYGADVNARDAAGRSALDYARSYKLDDCIALLKRYGAQDAPPKEEKPAALPAPAAQQFTAAAATPAAEAEPAAPAKAPAPKSFAL